MKKIILIIASFLLCFSLCACGGESDTGNSSDESSSSISTLLIDQDGVKIFYEGTTDDIGVGEGISLSVENNRSESIIVNIEEASVNGEMKTVIQPQMPLNVTSAGKKSKQAFIFSNSKIKGGNAQFKIKIMNENYQPIIETDFMVVSL